jgi:hypothetical protein
VATQSTDALPSPPVRAAAGLLRGMNEVWMPTPDRPARAMFDLCTNPRLVRVVQTLIGATELSYHRGICRPKLPKTAAAAFPFHQDSQYFDLECPDNTTVRRLSRPCTVP